MPVQRGESGRDAWERSGRKRHSKTSVPRGKISKTRVPRVKISIAPARLASWKNRREKQPWGAGLGRQPGWKTAPGDMEPVVPNYDL